MATELEILQHIKERLNAAPYAEPHFENAEVVDGTLLVSVDDEYVAIRAEKF